MNANLSSPFDARQEPPVAQMADDSQDQDELRVADQPQAEEGCAAHGPLGIVEESVNPGVREARGDLLNQEEVRVEPS
jgi:hypothetical protein